MGQSTGEAAFEDAAPAEDRIWSDGYATLSPMSAQDRKLHFCSRSTGHSWGLRPQLVEYPVSEAQRS